MRTVELLAPAGSFSSLIAAVECGADAVYLGGAKFNARAFADNFDNITLKKAVDYAHVRGVKIYVTLNTILFDNEIDEVIEYLTFLYNIDVDAVIIQDMALLKIINELIPDLPIHCSTQMTIHNTNGVEFLFSNGAQRVVLARELELNDVKEIVNKAQLEIEIFIHGALCVCYSGQCLMSSMIGGRSGNRGMCAQPCRRKYSLVQINGNNVKKVGKESYILSTRDLNTYDRLDEIINSGVKSLKIEGRMKKPEYVAVVVRNYHNYIETILKNEENKFKNNAQYELEAIFNRNFSEGYLFGNRNNNIVSIDRPDNRGVFIGNVIKADRNIIHIKLNAGSLCDGDGIEVINDNGLSFGSIVSGLRKNSNLVSSIEKGNVAEVFFKHKVNIGSKVFKTFDSHLNTKARDIYAIENIKKIYIKGKFIAKIDTVPRLMLEDNEGHTVEVIGSEIVSKAIKNPTTQEILMQQLRKTGDTPYLFEVLYIILDKDCFMPLSTINSLRRDAVEKLNACRSNYNNRKKFIIDNYKKEALINNSYERVNHDLEYIAAVNSFASAKGAIEADIDVIYVLNKEHIHDILMLCKENNKKCYYILPTILKNHEYNDYMRIIRANELNGLVISNLGQIDLAMNAGVNDIRANYSFNILNHLAGNFLHEHSINSICLSPELNISQIRALTKRINFRAEVITYGYLPVMTTEYCPLSTLNNGKCEKACKKGQYGIIDCKGKIFKILNEDNCRTQILNSDVLFVADEIERIIKSGVTGIRMDFYIEDKMQTKNIVDLYKNYQFNDDARSRIEEIKSYGFTKGHFFRGLK